MRKNIEDRVQDIEQIVKDIPDQNTAKKLGDRIELLEKIIEGLGYYIPRGKP